MKKTLCLQQEWNGESCFWLGLSDQPCKEVWLGWTCDAAMANAIKALDPFQRN